MPACLFPHPDDRAPHAAEVGYLCRPGFQRLEQQLAELPALAGWLHANLAAAGSSSLNPDKVNGSRDRPLLIRATIHDHITDIRTVLTSWAALVAEERQLVGPRSSEVTNTAPFLVAHLGWATKQVWIDDLAGEVGDLHRHAHQLCPSRPATHRLPAQCPTCEQTQLTRADGDDRIECQSCGRLWSEDEYHRLVTVLAEEQRNRSGWVTPELAAAAHGLNPKTVRSWAKRGVIAVVCAVLPGERDDRWRVHPDEVAARTTDTQEAAS